MKVLILFCVLCHASAVLYHLNDTTYNRMPPIFHLDLYESCLQRDGIYCSAKFDLVEGDDELMNTILDYSERKETHFNHARLNYGICVTKKCSKHLSSNKTNNLRRTVEGCLNDTFWEEYKLRIRLNEDPICGEKEKNIELEPIDIAATIVLIILILLNVAGIFYDMFTVQKNAKGNPLLLCFSIKRNWDKLTKENPETDRLRCLNGLN